MNIYSAFLFSGNHNFIKSTESDNERDTLSRTKKGPRISCPIDPSHTIYSTNLQKHILVCAATTKTMKMKSKPYYIENCNADQSSATRQPPPIDSGTTFDLLISKINLAYQNMVDREGLCTHVESKQQLPPPPSPDTDAQPIDFEAVAENIRIKLRSNGVNSLESASNDEPLSAYWRLRHVEQDVALVKELISRGIVDTKSSSNSSKLLLPISLSLFPTIFLILNYSFPRSWCRQGLAGAGSRGYSAQRTIRLFGESRKSQEN